MRTRFAPSPTGFLHVGGLRTALYSYLIAKQSNGTFLLRIEDTDQERSIPGAIENILQTLEWAGLVPDEGVILEGDQYGQKGSKGPYIQSQRLEIYQKHAKILWDKGAAYPCFCTKDRLEEMRKLQQLSKRPPMYDRQCLNLSKEQVDALLKEEKPYVLRQLIPREDTITFDDDIHGKISFRGDVLDDQVLLKSDGFPTYHLAHVVDDHLMDIDLVLRGEEWLSSLPKHLLLFRAFGWQAPRYAHVPLLLNADRTKLSKRQNDVAAEDYKHKGYLPEALINFIALLGWNPGTTQEMFSRDELAEAFSLERVQKAGAVFDVEKLNWLQGQWMRKFSPSEFNDLITSYVFRKYPEIKEDKKFDEKVALIQTRITLLSEAPEMLSYFYREPTPTLELLANEKQKVTTAMVGDVLNSLIEKLNDIDAPDWKHEEIERVLLSLLEEKGWKKGQILWPLRAALTGLPHSPGAFEVATALGKEKTLQRLEKARSLIK